VLQEYYDTLSHADSECQSSLPPLMSPQLATVSACDTNATPSSGASFTCSGPTTPEVQIDTIRLTTAQESSSCHRRRLSRDSGACELEDIARCLIDSAHQQPTTSVAGPDMSVTLPDGVTTDDIVIADTVSCVTLSS